MAIKDTSNPFLRRYPPNNRFINGAFKEQIEVHIRKDEFGESVTDKESYRLNLTSKRGSIGTGSTTVGKYMFEDGKYNPNADFSYAMRKDLSIVELDRYIKNLENSYKEFDKNLSAKVEAEIEAAKSQLKDMKNSLKENSKSNGDQTTSSE